LIGASGSVAAVLGAYLISFPTAWVRVVVPILVLPWAFDLPSILVLALWFGAQLVAGVASITEAAVAANVAVWAHIGGFLLGTVAGALVPRGQAPQMRSRGPTAKPNAPGPAGLISSIANLGILLLSVRILLTYFEVQPGAGLLGQVATFINGVTEPLLAPIGAIVPEISLLGQPFDLAALVLIILIDLVAAFLMRAMRRRQPI
jgi:uncharacterized protein YggT (Ycf19 family)